MWDNDQIGGDIQDTFPESPLIMAPMPYINGDEEAAANEFKPEQEAAIDATEEQPVILADEPKNIEDDEQRRYPKRTQQPVDRMRP